MQTELALSVLFDYATEGILITNDKGLIVRINPSAERMFGYEKDELMEMPIEWLIPRPLKARHEKYRENYNHNPHARSMGQGMDLYAMRKDGSEFPVEVSLSPFTSNGSSYVIAFIIDITVRKEQQDAIRRQKDQVEAFAERLRASNEELQNFAYISSHDLQEPLRKIRAFGDRLQMIEKDTLSDTGKDYLERMLNAAVRMQTLINDLLQFSRLTTRAQAFRKVDLDIVLQEVLSDMEVSIERSGAVITADTLPSIDGEATQMRQLFQNLVSNAIKFTPEGEKPKITISCRIIPETGSQPEMVEITVKDEGIGFEEKYTDRIFSIFQRLEGQKYEGSGIGLAICRKIAMRHGGNIIAKSKPGEGAAFIVTLRTKNDNETNTTATA